MARIAFVLGAVVVIGIVAWSLWMPIRPAKLPEGIASSNGRIETTEIELASKFGGRVLDEVVDEGDFVTAGQVVAHMDIEVLRVQHREAVTRFAVAESEVETARSVLAQRQSEKAAAEAAVAQREAELGMAKAYFARAECLAATAVMPKDEFDIRRASLHAAETALRRSKADLAAAESAIRTAKATVIRAEANVPAAQAAIARIQAEIEDGTLKAPRDGRVQCRIAQPGEVLPAGGKVLSMVDLTDVYMTVFMSGAAAGRVKVGNEVWLVPDAAPELVIPAEVSFIADVTPFTPGSAEARQKPVVRITAHVPPGLLEKHSNEISPGAGRGLRAARPAGEVARSLGGEAASMSDARRLIWARRGGHLTCGTRRRKP